MSERQGLGGKVVAVMLIIAMIRRRFRVHADIEIEWKGCCHCRRIERDRFRSREEGAGVTRLGRIGRPKEMASAIPFPSSDPSDERGYWQESISSPMVALIKSELETTVPMRKCRLNRGKGATDDLVRLN